MRPSCCCICYENGGIKCFDGCENHLCMDCLTRLIEINKASMIYYTCPCCRQEIIKNINIEFSNFCNREIEILNRIVSLLEKEISEKKKIHLDEAWYIFQESVMNIDTNNIE